MPRAKYFIAHLLRGNAAAYHSRLTRFLSTQFNTVPLHEKVAPHITVKIPFEATATELAGLEHVLQGFADRANAVRERGVPPLEGEARKTFIEAAEKDYMDYSLIASAAWSVEDGKLVLRIPISG